MAVCSAQLHPVQRPEVAPLDGRDAHDLDLRPRLTSAFSLHHRMLNGVSSSLDEIHRRVESSIALDLIARSILPHYVSLRITDGNRCVTSKPSTSPLVILSSLSLSLSLSLVRLHEFLCFARKNLYPFFHSLLRRAVIIGGPEKKYTKYSRTKVACKTGNSKLTIFIFHICLFISMVEKMRCEDYFDARYMCRRGLRSFGSQKSRSE